MTVGAWRLGDTVCIGDRRAEILACLPHEAQGVEEEWAQAVIPC